jgi:hypothetical protein
MIIFGNVYFSPLYLSSLSERASDDEEDNDNRRDEYNASMSLFFFNALQAHEKGGWVR